MERFSKLWGSLIGSVITAGAAYGLIPETVAEPLRDGATALLPILGAAFGTYIFPPNAK